MLRHDDEVLNLDSEAKKKTAPTGTQLALGAMVPHSV